MSQTHPLSGDPFGRKGQSKGLRFPEKLVPRISFRQEFLETLNFFTLGAENFFEVLVV